MSKDIRSFFLPKGKKTEQSAQETIGGKKNKKRVIVIDSDSDDSIINSPKKKKKSCESDKKCDVQKQTEKLKPVNVCDLFGNEKIKRSAPKPTTHKIPTDVKCSTKQFESIHSDEEFEATLSQIDQIEDAVLNNRQGENIADSCRLELTTLEKSSNKSDNSRTLHISTKKHKSSESHQIKLKSTKESSQSEGVKTNQSISDHRKHEGLSDTKLIVGKHEDNTEDQIHKSAKKETPSKKTGHLNESISSPSDPIEKKRQQALSYMKYLQRGGPKHLGSKELPEGKTGCLSGLVFVITGVLDSLEREEATQLIEQYGGKVSPNVSRNTSYLICGEDSGQTKLTKAEKFGTQQINEDGLLDLIRMRSKNVTSPCENSPRQKSSTENRKRNDERKEDETCKQPKQRKFEDISQQAESKDGVKNTKLRNSKSQSSVLKSEVKFDSHIESEKMHTKNNDSVVDAIPRSSNAVSIDSDSIKSSLWVDKYRPTKTKQIIGQQGDRSSLRKLTIWLANWKQNHSGNKKHVKPSPWAKNDDGAFFKAALLSGPPGIGKTTMAHLVSKELGFDIVEFNASDTRSKKLLHIEISELLSSKTLFGYFQPSNEVQQSSNKHVLLMDEVDGMAGNADRGGVQELILLIKNTRVPIICMCNDRNHPKIRSLANYCFDLRVMKPRLEQIRGAMMSVCYKEGLKIPADSLNDIICGANFDIRQILHHLSLWSVKGKQFPAKEQQAMKIRKDMKMGPWDVVKKVFSIEDHKTMSIHDKSDLFFHDYSFSPLFVQENYLSVSPAATKGNTTKTLQCISSTADSISMGDIIDKCIRSRGSWSLLPVQAMFSSVIPGDLMEGYIRGKIEFPSWLGKNSRTGKLDRLLQELHVHTRLSTSGSKQALNMEYLTHIRDAVIHPLISEGAAGVQETLSVLQSYNLLREDLESLIELTQWPNQKDPMSAVESKVKAALTRAYNKEGILTPYSVVSVVKKRSGGDTDDFDDMEDDEEEDEDNIKVDAMIKTKKPQKNVDETLAKSARGRGKSRDSNSKGGQKRGRGRGK